ncbi:deoxyribodipyrimidine photo-lyase [Wenzhouxiangella sp. AB-CW3]|uniref:cryptochrome/photolyase family protein n=1 Tax=Wenzhouxiangella sp. AB-CW3 TaxID=2771012 RepID=UPI00168B28C5|nr:deoxyribodipyrimidine photo-lyase [Wenzhouxiangella sp. AB-CW3]QOC23581.1 deoxyribodipyrimidine photo-lyase [Wenzhouxiangella sp. AB-CW3]
MPSTAIVWLRRDLRLADNPALDQARRSHDRVVPVFIWDPDAEGHWSPGAASRWWLHHSLAALDERLRQRGSRLILAHGDSLEALRRISRACHADAVYWNRCYEPALVERDRRIKIALRDRDGLEVESANGSVLFEPWQLRKSDGGVYRVFTPFWKQMQRHWIVPAVRPEPRRLAPPARWPVSLALDELKLLPRLDWAGGFSERWEPGETGAGRRLRGFVEQTVIDYAQGRDRPGIAGTSGLSPHLHFGEVSPWQVARALDDAGELPTGQGALTFMSEIAWREFSIQMLFHCQELPDKPLNSSFDRFPWRGQKDYADDLRAWQRGETGIPLVDAGMRELWTTGWMHNRVRMVVASFLTKNLLIPWQEGARWFWDTLVDADLANNTQGWQWTAGCGADAAPYFRVFNPVLQGEKFDPDSTYVRAWCPELASIKGKRIHQPLDREASARLGYPAPIVNLKRSRQRALDAWQQIRA